MGYPKHKLYTIIALLVLTYGFTVPIITHHGVHEHAVKGEVEKIPSYIFPMWDFYNQGRYVSPTTRKDAVGNFKKLVETKSEVGVMSTPLWYVSLEAPNYPKESFPNGIPVYYHFDGYSGDVHEMNTINHFIGMYPMERGGILERKLVPYIMLIMTLGMIWFIAYDGKISLLFMVIPIVVPFGFLVLYAGWLYWYGHNMQDWGAFKIKPFMPTVLGDGKVAQFTTHSYPTTGFYMLSVISILSALALFSKIKYLKAKKEQ